MRPLRSITSALVALAMVSVACGGGSGDAAARPLPVDDWDAITAAADGQTVRWWLFGGDERINRYIDDNVVPAAAEQGVTLERVPVSDTADAVQRVLAEKRAGTTADGTVDMIWINGENFALGHEAGVWLESWSDTLPNAELVDQDTVDTDFGVEVNGEESPWSRALFVFAHDPERTPDPPRTFEELLAYAEANPGRVTYPAPPDFTGSAFVRLAVQELGEDGAVDLLAKMVPSQWREGSTYPGSEAELSELFGNGQVDLAMSYDPNFVTTGVRQGTFAESVRPYVFETGTLQNTSYVTIPGNASNREGALVVANLLLDPQLQAIKADPDVLGVPSVLDLERLDSGARELFGTSTESPYILTDYGMLVDELPVAQVEELESRWKQEVLR